ncbi:MAG: hypothetical protein ABSC54_10005 [Smithellaceae bacterium]
MTNGWTQEVERLQASNKELIRVSTAANHALKSYACGNSSPELALAVSKELEVALKAQES